MHKYAIISPKTSQNWGVIVKIWIFPAAKSFLNARYIHIFLINELFHRKTSKFEIIVEI